MTPEQFYAQYLPYAQSVSQRTGLDPRLVLAQSALETGYGKSAPGMNFFGIKSHGRKGGNTLSTQEFEGGRMVQQPASFRGYETPEQSFMDYADFIASNPRYKGVLAADGLEAQISEMAKSGYATDPNYGSKLASIASRFDPNSPKVIAAETMSLLGKGPQTSTKGPQMMQEQKPQGLLGSLGIQKRDEAAGGETAQPFYQRDTFKDTAAVLAQGFGRMGIMGMEEIADGIAKQRTEAKAKNKTMEALSKMNTPQAQAAVEYINAGGDAVSALKMAFERPEAQGQVVSAAQLREMYPGSEIADGLYNLKKDNTITKVGGAPQVVIDQSAPGAESELRKKLMGNRGEELAAHISAGNVAAGRQGDLNILQELAPLAPSGPVEGRFAEMFPEFNDVAAVRQSVVRRIAPTMRVEGSGSTSDIEFNAMLDSFGSLRNTPEANMAISQAMINKAQFDMQRRDIVQQYSNDQISLKEMDAQIAALESNFSIPSQVRSILDRYSTSGETPSGGGSQKTKTGVTFKVIR